MWAPSTWEPRMSLAGQFTNFCRTYEQSMNEESCAPLFDGNRCSAIDPTAVRQDAAVHVGNESNPAGHGGFEVTKNCGAIGDEGRDESSAPRTDWKERVVLRLAWITASRLFRDCGSHPQQFHTGDGRNLNFGLVRGTEDGESGSPPRLAVREDTRAGCIRHYKAMQDTSRERKAHESDDCPRGASSGSLGCHGAFHKTRCVEARCSNRGDAQFGSTR
ncbi:hypothetical protein TCDM_13395 [Trypanosoma cruzi Dm28c]|uniref:Uncharacterized protein n=1 Tax=Trypanosoma cruzi Dm28c TaxID=1416333 RepID=V5AIS9_TRYCR|nr:hypothetical protein TCDM_13395 [Trypanosoma cruzi Dm28c]